MDSVTQSLPMPPSPGAAAYIPPQPGGFAPPPAPMAQPAPQQQAAPRPVGRPSGDPDVNDQRVERSQLRQRLKNILPTSMTDGRIAIFRLEGRKGRTKGNMGKPVMQILFRDLEKALDGGGYTDTGDYVKDQIHEKYDKGRFLWEAQDNRGRTMPEAGETEIDLSENPEEEPVDEPEPEIEPEALSDMERQVPVFQTATPPPPPPFDAAVHAQTLREVMSEEKRGAESMVTVMMTMMQAQNQQQQMAMQQQMAQAETRRLEEDRRRDREEAKEREERRLELERMRLEQERREKEESRREDRDRDRRKDEMQMQMQFFQAIMSKPERPDTTTPMLMKMIESKGDRDGMKEVFNLMGESSRQAMVTQAEGAKHMMNAQAEANKMLMTNVLGVSQKMVESMAENNADPTDDPMEKIGRVFKMIAPALGALQAPKAVAIQPQQPQQRAAPQQQVPPTEYIKGGLYTIMRLENGEIPVTKRWQALKWCADYLPKEMLDAIRSGVEENVMAIGSHGMDSTLMAWIADDAHVQFLRECLADIQRILLGAVTQADAKASLERHAAYMQAKGQPQAQQQPQQAVPATAEAEQMIPADVEDHHVAQPVATNGKRRAPPPAEAKAPEATAPPAAAPEAPPASA